MTTSDPALSAPGDIARVRYAALIDTETTGLNPKTSTTIEVAVMLYDLKLAQPCASYSSLIHGDSNEGYAINGIPPAMLAEAREPSRVWAAVKWVMEPADVIIAHRAEFDRQFVPDLGRPWVCSKVDIKWPDRRRGDHLVQLALSLGIGVASAHRAMADVDTLARILTRIAERGTDLEALVRHAMRPKQRFHAQVSYEERQIAKDHGFLFDYGRKVWYRDMPLDDVAELPFRVVAA
jgi:DNA polymerase III subunit epsilon